MNAGASAAVCGEIQPQLMAHWYLIHTKPSGEALAQVNLERQGYRVYYPRLLQTLRRRGRWVDCVGSLFPRYLFLHLRVGEQSLSPVRSTLGVANLVRFGFDYAVVADAVIENLRLREDPQTGLHRLNDQVAFEPGSSLRVVGGIFDGLEGVFQRECGAERVVVLLKILGQETAVKIPAALVVPRCESPTLPWRAQHAHR